MLTTFCLPSRYLIVTGLIFSPRLRIHLVPLVVQRVKHLRQLVKHPRITFTDLGQQVGVSRVQTDFNGCRGGPCLYTAVVLRVKPVAHPVQGAVFRQPTAHVIVVAFGEINHRGDFFPRERDVNRWSIPHASDLHCSSANLAFNSSPVSPANLRRSAVSRGFSRRSTPLRTGALGISATVMMSHFGNNSRHAFRSLCLISKPLRHSPLRR